MRGARRVHGRRRAAVQANREWHPLDGKAVAVDSPDCITVIGRLDSDAEVSVHVAAVPFHPAGTRMEIYGREGVIVVRAEGSMNISPSEVHMGTGKNAVEKREIPAQYRVVPAATPSGPPYNVAQAYARATDALRGQGAFEVDFDLAAG